ncbi:MAG: hypothetical protein QW641_00370 [Candidatus Aenigmatarchaeota archaeon]
MRKIAITSLKKGIGRTSFSFSLAFAFKEMGKSTIAILDSPIIASNKYVDDFFKEQRNISNYITFFEGLSVLLRKGDVNLDREIVNILLQKIGDEKRFDILVWDIDYDILSNCSDFFEEIIFVSLPYKSDLIELKETAKNIKRKVYVVINFLPTSMEIDDKSISNFLGLELLGKISYDESVQESIYYKLPVTFYKRYSLSSKQIFDIASKLLVTEYNEKFFYRILRFFDSLKKSKIKLTIEELSF